MSESGKNEGGWATPSVLLGVLGMLSGIGGSYMSFNSRLSSVEVRVEEKALASDARLVRIEASQAEMSGKIDRLIERAGQ